jgi:hypothetical protein
MAEGASLMRALLKKTLTADSWVKILDDFTHNLRRATGQPPDRRRERRRAVRRKTL